MRCASASSGSGAARRGGSTRSASATGSPTAPPGAASAATTCCSPAPMPCTAGRCGCSRSARRPRAPMRARLATDRGGLTSPAFGTVTHDDVHLVIRDRDIHFGRAPSNDIRIGHAPILDEIVPRSTGWISAHRGRLVVANADDRLAFDVVVEGTPRSPCARACGCRRRTPSSTSSSSVRSRTRSPSPTTSPAPTCRSCRPARTPTTACRRAPGSTSTRRQRQVLDAYVAPVIAGGSPASHQQVAHVLGISRSLVRLECNRIWSKMLLAGIPMPRAHRHSRPDRRRLDPPPPLTRGMADVVWPESRPGR